MGAPTAEVSASPGSRARSPREEESSMEVRDIPVLETERLRLRAFRLSDFDDYAAMCGDPEVTRYLTTRFDREQAWRHLAFLIGHWVLRGFGMWAVEEKATGAFVGRIGFAEPEGWPGFELAWTLARPFWGRGYATDGARAALAYGFKVQRRDRSEERRVGKGWR